MCSLQHYCSVLRLFYSPCCKTVIRVSKWIVGIAGHSYGERRSRESLSPKEQKQKNTTTTSRNRKRKEETPVACFYGCVRRNLQFDEENLNEEWPQATTHLHFLCLPTHTRRHFLNWDFNKSQGGNKNQHALLSNICTKNNADLAVNQKWVALV